MIPSFRMGIIAAAVQLASASPPSDLLLHFEGTTFVDSGIHSITVQNNGSLLSTTQFKFGAKSMVPSSCIQVTHASLAPGSGDFKFECWIYLTNAGGQQFIFDQRSPGGMCVYHTGGALNFYDGTTSSNYAYTGSAISLNAWHHIEVCRKGTTVYLFLDGVLGGTFTSIASAWINPLWVIGAAQYTPVGVNQLIGFIDEVRIRTGVGSAEHITSFTPPTAPYTP